MYILYLDEFGHPGPYAPSNPKHRHHPLFGFAGLAIPGNCNRDFDRSFFRLKSSFYSNEIKRAETLRGVRPERFEPKNLASRRDRRFATQVIGLVGKCGGCVFAYGCVKDSTPKNHSYEGLYNSLMQGTLRQFEKFLRNRTGRTGGSGVIIMDRRTEAQNRRVLESAQSHLYSDPSFRKPDVRIVETPLLVPSEWYHGVQAAHMVGQAVGKIYWHRKVDNKKYKVFDDYLGPVLRAQTHTIGGWHSVFVYPR